MKVIAVLGPESTGKSTLCENLSSHLQVPWIPEYAREYVEKLDRPYNQEDIEQIARHQIKQIQEGTKASAPFLLLDTDLIITKVWLMHCYNYCPSWLQKAIEEAPIDHFLLCKPDLPWVYDPVRENPNLRTYLFDWYKREIETLQKSYTIISGQGQERFDLAQRTIESL